MNDYNDNSELLPSVKRSPGSLTRMGNSENFNFVKNEGISRQMSNPFSSPFKRRSMVVGSPTSGKIAPSPSATLTTPIQKKNTRFQEDFITKTEKSNADKL